MDQAREPWVPFDERAPLTFEERRARSYAVPVGSRCACRECTSGWALSHGDPAELEAELRTS